MSEKMTSIEVEIKDDIPGMPNGILTGISMIVNI